LYRPIEGDWPYVWIDATYVKVPQAGRIVSIAVIIAVGVNTDGVREVVGMATGPSEAEPFWVDFLRGLTRRGLRGVKGVISDAHLGLTAAIAQVFKATWQRCRVHVMRNASAHAVRLAGALPLEQNDEWQRQCRSMQLEGLQTVSGNTPRRICAVVAA
jgi:putative transposase